MIPFLLLDLAVAPVASWLGTKAVAPVSAWMYERGARPISTGSKAIRPGPPYRIAAQEIASLLGLDLSETALDKAALVFRYGLAVSWAPTYARLRRRTGLGPSPPGLASGAAMSAIVDEGLTPALGFQRPESRLPRRRPRPAERRACGVRGHRRGCHRSCHGRPAPSSVIPRGAAGKGLSVGARRDASGDPHE